LRSFGQVLKLEQIAEQFAGASAMMTAFGSAILARAANWGRRRCPLLSILKLTCNDEAEQC
jgi:hypothetical protein